MTNDIRAVADGVIASRVFVERCTPRKAFSYRSCFQRGGFLGENVGAKRHIAHNFGKPVWLLSDCLRTFSMEERDFLKRVPNHASFRSTLIDLSLQSDIAVFDGQVLVVASAWFSLAGEHLEDAKVALAANRARTVYSRAYYAAYNASKAVRYRVRGVVTLHADDHKKAGDLPDDFPNAAGWAARIIELYEHRLRADYDNWSSTSSEHSLRPDECVDHAEKFLADCAKYVHDKYGESL